MLASVHNIDFMMEGWVTHRIVAYENGVEAYEVLADLCPKCSENLRQAVNPTNWPRMKAPSREFSQKSVGESVLRYRKPQDEQRNPLAYEAR